jgi:RNA polymerase sigma factor (sigma-70 family)
MEKQFDSLSTYITLAKKIVSKFAPTFYGSLRQELLNNDDAIADIASAIMVGDWKWDKDRVGFNGKSKTKYSYRNQCGIWAIKTYLTNKYRKQNTHYSLDNVDAYDINFTDNIPDNIEYDPATLLENRESESLLKSNINNLLNSGIITDKQREQIRLYYFEEKTLSEIGNIFGVTREAIRQNIQKGLARIRTYAH